MDTPLQSRRWRRVRALFERCVELSPGERERFVDETCGDDDLLRRELEELLTLDALDDGSMEPPDPASLGADLAAQALGRRFGSWRLESVLGSGGMSTVYLASRTDAQFEQRAAVKLVKRGMDTEDILRRFLNERQVLADLDHPGIARLIDGGATDDGLPYLVMEYVPGVPVNRWCDEQRLDVEARLRLLQSICEPVQYANEQGVIHRDLKPSNILVTEDGRPKLLDFGIAKVLDSTPSAGTVDVTATELRLMTPEYASPEQVRGRPIGPASDVYSLGVILYELLSGHRPYPMLTRRRHDLERAICELDPPRPSAVVGRTPSADTSPERAADAITVGEVASRRATDSRRLRRRLAGDLDTIALVALRKEPSRRYASASELAADIERSLEGRPLLARPDTWRYRSSRFVRRNKVVVGSALGIMLALLVGLVASTTFWLGEAEQRREAQLREYVSRIAAAGLALQAGNVVDARRHLEQAPESFRGWEWRHFAARLDRSARTFEEHEGIPTAVAFSPDGRWLASGDDRRIIVRSLDPDGRVIEWSGHDAQVVRLAFSPDGARLLAVHSRGSIVVWRHGDERVEWEVEHPAGFHAASFSPDGTRVAAGAWDGSIRLLDSGTGAELRQLPGHADLCCDLSFSSAHPRLASISRDGILHLVDLDTSEVTVAPRPQGFGYRSVVFHPDGRRLVTGGPGGIVMIRDGSTGVVQSELPISGMGVRGLAFGPSGERLATVSNDGTVRTWEFPSGRPLGIFLGHRDLQVNSVAFHPDESHLASAASDRTVKLWSLETADVRSLDGDPGWYLALVLSPDGSSVLESGTTRLSSWSLAAEPRWTIPLAGPAHALAFGPDPSWFAQGFVDGRVLQRDARSGAELRALGEHGVEVREVAVSPDGRRVASAGVDGAIRLWSVAGDADPVELLGRESPVNALAFSPDGTQLLSGSGDGTARLWSLEAPASPLILAGHGEEIWDVAVHPRGDVVATASWDGMIKLWDVHHGRELATLEGHANRVYCVAFSPDGTRLVSGGEDYTLILWDPATGGEMTKLYGHDARVDDVYFTRDGRFIVSKSKDGVVKVWDTIDPSLSEG